ncbi:hypothetical protein K466DRAFT_607643 [Polyporus arcularius HHB13444]|uniref:Uncharacterized protein n=1 Tax=Polyporus arcularius HHB13444 TaxID=1314778 RepID=A0A5C3NLG4_9APHY|nr:hypothetical protein K466DRAFT_607643 [Polyporus arcularius HHB13444]
MPIDELVTTETELEIDQLLPSDTLISGQPDENVEDAITTVHNLPNDNQVEEPDTPTNGQEDDEAHDKADNYAATSAVVPRRSSRKRQGEALKTVSTSTANSKRLRTRAVVDTEAASTSSRTTHSKAAASVAASAGRMTQAKAKDTTPKNASRGRTKL